MSKDGSASASSPPTMLPPATPPTSPSIPTMAAAIEQLTADSPGLITGQLLPITARTMGGVNHYDMYASASYTPSSQKFLQDRSVEHSPTGTGTWQTRRRAASIRAIALASTDLCRRFTVPCPWVTLAACAAHHHQQQQHLTATATATACVGRTHFRAVIAPHTDVRLGSCAYLDSCYMPSKCRFVHWVIADQEKGNLKQNRGREYWEMLPLEERVRECAAQRIPFSGAVAAAQRGRPRWFRMNLLAAADMGCFGSKWDAVMIDPPWKIHMNLPTNSAGDHEILRMNVESLQNNGVIFLWCTSRSIESGLRCLKAWGYSFCDELVWVKTTQLGGTIVAGRTGHYLNHSKEHCLVGVKGSPMLNCGIDLNYILSPARETTHKPDEIYSIIERLVGPGANKLELFGGPHNIRAGWHTIGDELPPLPPRLQAQVRLQSTSKRSAATEGCDR